MPKDLTIHDRSSSACDHARDRRDLSAISMYRVNSVASQLASCNKVNSVKQRHAINFRGSVMIARSGSAT